MKAHPPELRERAAELRAQGYGYHRVARELSISKTTVGRWAHPELAAERRESARVRKDGYRGTCVDCGAPTDGSNGRAKAPKRCIQCLPAHRTLWTREAVIAAVQLYAAENGRHPRVEDWLGWNGDRGMWPNSRTVQNVFGSWSAAIRAAGFPCENNRKGIPLETILRLREAGMTYRAIAEATGCSERNISNRIRRHRWKAAS